MAVFQEDSKKKRHPGRGGNLTSGGGSAGTTTATPPPKAPLHPARGGWREKDLEAWRARTSGTAQPRETIGSNDGPAPPDTMALASEGGRAAGIAAVRARRQGAGRTVLTGLSMGTGAPRARLNTRTLLGY